MMPQEFIDAQNKAIKESKTYCKNSEVKVENTKCDYKTKVFEFEIKETQDSKCGNKRRHCSAYCQECSDKHNS